MDRHYSRHSVGSPHFVPPCVAFLTLVQPGAVWIAIEQRYQKHAWPGAIVNCAFRNETDQLASDMIREATELTRARWPGRLVITMVDPTKIRRTRSPGNCYLKAGWRHLGWTKGGHGSAQLRVLGVGP